MLSTREINYYEFGDFRLDVARQQLLKNGTPQALTHKAFLTLLILVRDAGKIVEKEDIISEIWNDSFVEEGNLSQYIYLLRKLLGTDENGKSYIETITKRGFRFAACVAKNASEIGSGATGSNSEIFKVKTPQTQERSNGNRFKSVSYFQPHTGKKFGISVSSPQKVLPKDKRLGFPLLLILIAILGLIFAAAYFYKVYPNQSLNSGKKSIAVLPFQTIGKESNNEKLGFGMADAIIARINKLKGIQVRSTNAVFSYADQPPVNTWEAGSALGVDAILEGTVQRDEGRVRISARLMNISDGRSLWAENFDEDFTDIFTLQNRISAKVAQSLEINLTREQEMEIAQNATKKPNAFQAYQSGIYFLNKRSKDGLQKAVEYFRQAIAFDYDYAQAYAGLANTYNLLGYYKFADESEMKEKAREAAEKALSLDSNSAEAYSAIAYTQQQGAGADLNLAAKSLERALEISPYNSEIRVRYAWLKLSQNNLEEGVRQARVAQEYNPLSNVSNNVLCTFLSFQRKFDEALPYCEKAISITPDLPMNRTVLAKVYFFNGRQKDAAAQLQIQIDASSGSERNEALGLLSYFYAKSGRSGEACKIMETLKLKLAEEPNLYNALTLTTRALGKKEEALMYFKKSVQLKQLSADSIKYRYDPLWEEARNDKEFSFLTS